MNDVQGETLPVDLESKPSIGHNAAENLMSNSTICPKCDAKGRKVERTTLESLLHPSAKALLPAGPFRFCRNETCDVVYFDELHLVLFKTNDVMVPVFQKTSAPDRLVCYCFQHTVSGIGQEIMEHGQTDVLESIAFGCRSGLDDCERNNPQGACCLANVRQVVKAALEAQDKANQVSMPCCSCQSEDEES